MQDSIFTKIIKGEIPSYKIVKEGKPYFYRPSDGELAAMAEKIRMESEI